MASGPFNKALEAYLSADIDIPADAIKVMLVDTNGYTPNLTSHQFLSDIPSANRIGASPNLVGKTVLGGAFNADDTSISGVLASAPISEGLAIYQDTGNPATSRLLAWIDQGTGLPIDPNGGVIDIVWDNTLGYIFKLNA